MPSKTPLTAAEEECYQHFKDTHYRNAEGCFVIRLPFLDHPTHLDTECIVEACMKRLEKRIVCEPDMVSEYKAFMLEFFELGYM